MMNGERNEIVMISGGSSGIGLSIARRLGKNGAKISICGRRLERLQAAEEALRQEGIEVIAVQSDVSREEDVERWFAETERKMGAASILVNNAGAAGRNPLLQLDEEQWDYTMSVNCRGPFLCTRRALPSMIKAQQGRLFFIASIGAQYYRKHHSLYFTSKWALRGFANCVAKEVQEHHIHVHILCPGMTETNFFEVYESRPHPLEMAYVSPELVADWVERLCGLPDHVDTNEYSLFPSFQLKNFGLRR